MNRGQIRGSRVEGTIQRLGKACIKGFFDHSDIPAHNLDERTALNLPQSSSVVNFEGDCFPNTPKSIRGIHYINAQKATSALGHHFF